jgi:hypothetical protein
MIPPTHRYKPFSGPRRPERPNV